MTMATPLRQTNNQLVHPIVLLVLAHPDYLEQMEIKQFLYLQNYSLGS